MIEIILLIFLIASIFTSLIIVGWAIGRYNFMQSGLQNIKTMFSNMKTEYQRRYDLFLNLAEAVKSFKNHEAKTYLNVAEARSQVNFKGSKAQTMKSMNFLDSFFSRLMVANERYPELKAKLHSDLMNEVRITEDRINVARTDYNDVTREYNLAIKTFPSNIIAGMFRFNEEVFYENESISNQAPRINLG